MDFNPRSHEGSDDFLQSKIYLYQSFQSTLPRRERPLSPVPRSLATLISIHAPTKGATPSAFCARLTSAISIHAPTKGATAFLNFDNPVIVNFNPRSHEGSDKKSVEKVDQVVDFNPRSHEGSDTVAFPPIV